MSEPVFRYHPDPLATGSAVRDTHTCGVCGDEREFRYDGPIYGRRPETLCLHCIHSGMASHALGTTGVAIDGGENLDMPADFSDAQGVPDDVPLSIVEEITRRTPGFFAWQDPSWLYHCGDGAAFLGPAGHAELDAHPEALAMLREDLHRLGWSGPDTDHFLRCMDRAGQPCAYLFRCLHCGTDLASWDIS